MSPAIPSPVSAGRAAPPRRSQQNSPLSTSRSVPGPSPASSRISTTGCASTTSRLRPSDQQFDYIAAQRMKFAQRGPIVTSIPRSANCGNFKNQGTTWERSPQAVNDHASAHGIAIPYGVYGVRQSRLRGRRHLPRTASRRQPGQMVAARRPRTLPRRLRTAGARRLRRQQLRIRCFKYALQTRLADPHHLKVTVCHYPSGASKWNPIDHRLFSEISKNWAGHPLRSYRRSSTTSVPPPDTGFVTAQLVDRPKGVKISDAQRFHRPSTSSGPTVAQLRRP